MKHKIIILAFVILGFSSCCNRKLNSTFKIEASYAEAYCGGAAPSEEMIAELERPKPYSGPLYIYRTPDMAGDPVVLDVQNGSAKVKCLMKGSYFLTRHKSLPMEGDFEQSELHDRECLMIWQQMEMAPIEVVNNMDKVEVLIQYACDPCQEPMP